MGRRADDARDSSLAFVGGVAVATLLFLLTFAGLGIVAIIIAIGREVAP